MFWLFLFGIAGLLLGIWMWKRGDLDDCFAIAFITFLGVFAGTLMAGISTGVTHLIIPEDKYEIIEIERQEIAVSETGDVLYFEIVTQKDKSYIHYLNADGEIKEIAANRCKIEVASSDYCMVHSRTQLAGWYHIFAFPSEQRTIYVPEECLN